MKQMKPEILVKLKEQDLDKLIFLCDECGTHASYIDAGDGEEFIQFCKENNRNPNELLFAFKKECDCPPPASLVMQERATLQWNH